MKDTSEDIIIATASNESLLTKGITKFNAQYLKLSVKTANDFHYGFLIIDKTEFYHIEASIKDAGKRNFGITKIENNELIQSLINKAR